MLLPQKHRPAVSDCQFEPRPHRWREALDPQLEADSGRWRLSALHRVPAVPQSTTERACHFTAGALLAWHWGAKLRTGEFGLWRLSPHRRLRGKTAASGAGSTRSPTISSAATR